MTGATGDLVATEQFPDNEFQRVDLASTALQAVTSGQADIVFDDYTFLALAASENPDLLLLPAVSVEPSGLMAPIGDQTWINWLNYFLHDYYSSGVSTCGCGTDKLAGVVQGRAAAAELRLLIDRLTGRGHPGRAAFDVVIATWHCSRPGCG